MTDSTLKNIIILVVVLLAGLVTLSFFNLIPAVSAGVSFITSNLMIGVVLIAGGLFILTKRLAGGKLGKEEIVASVILIGGIVFYAKWIPGLMVYSLQSVGNSSMTSATFLLNFNIDPLTSVIIAGIFGLAVYYGNKRR